MSNVWKIHEENTENHETLAKKHKDFLVPSQRYQDFRHILENPKIPKNSMGFNYHNQSHKTTEDQALNNKEDKAKAISTKLME